MSEQSIKRLVKTAYYIFFDDKVSFFNENEYKEFGDEVKSLREKYGHFPKGHFLQRMSTWYVDIEGAEEQFKDGGVYTISEIPEDESMYNTCVAATTEGLVALKGIHKESVKELLEAGVIKHLYQCKGQLVFSSINMEMGYEGRHLSKKTFCDMLLNKHEGIKLPAGRYYIGDPCYAIEDNEEEGIDWHDFCNGHWEALGATGFKFLDYDVYCSGTAHGDGGYRDELGNYYSVDAGIIGILPMELVEKTCGKKDFDRLDGDLGKIWEFDKEFTFKADSRGTFTFDGHTIITDWDLMPDEEEEEDE